MGNKWLAFWDSILDMYLGALELFMDFLVYVVLPVVMLVLIWVLVMLFVMLLVGVA